MDEPYYRPGEETEKPPVTPTLFTPQKPAGPDPVTPTPLPEGSETDRHAQLFAYDPGSGQFKPVEWTAGKLKVDAVFSGSISIGHVSVDNFIDQQFTVIDTTIVRDPMTNLVSLIAETDGVRTKNSIFTRDAQGCVTNIHEVLV